MERDREYDPQDPSYGDADADKAPEGDDNASGPIGEVKTDEDTSGGPLSGGAGEGSGHGADDAPDVDVPGGADDGA
jgi:hypothetical protein